MKKHFTKYPSSYVKASLGASSSRTEWLDYICSKWKEDGCSNTELAQFRGDIECGAYDEWIDAIQETLGDFRFQQFKKALSVKGYEDYVDVADGRIYDRSEANDWLKAKIAEYGNTYSWDDDLKRDLNKLIKQFGNTYFWDR